MKRLRPRQGDGPGTHAGGGGRNADVDLRGQRSANETHYSTTDPEARMARQRLGKETRLCITSHVLMENRHGLVVDVELTQTTGTSEREAAMTMLQRSGGRRRRCTFEAENGDGIGEFVDRCRMMGVVPHGAMRESWWVNAHLARLKEISGGQVSQRRRKRVVEIFGWAKSVGGGRKLRYLGVDGKRPWAELTATAFNLVRLRNLVEVLT